MKDSERVGDGGTTRRIVVSDRLPESRRVVQGRRLEDPPDSRPDSVRKAQQSISRPQVRKPVLVIGLSAAVVFVVVMVVLAFKQQTTSQPRATATPIESQSTAVAQSGSVSGEPDELRRTDYDAKQVIRSISRDGKPYSFTENALNDIHARVVELSRSTRVANSLRDLQENGASLGSQANKVGLQPGLAMLMGMALANGSTKGSASSVASTALPLLSSLNKSFGSNEAESCLILIAAFHEGPGTHRSHPLLRRMNRVVTDPLTQRNVWYLNEQNIISADAYGLVVDTIACGIIARNPRQFGIQADPLRF